MTVSYTGCFAALRIVAPSAVALLWSSGAFAQAGGLTLPEQGGPISGTPQVGQAAVGVAEAGAVEPAPRTDTVTRLCK